jgi:hypothetical protein
MRRGKKRKSPKAHQSFEYDIIVAIKKFSTRWIQQHRERSLTMIRVGHTLYPKANEQLQWGDVREKERKKKTSGWQE